MMNKYKWNILQHAGLFGSVFDDCGLMPAESTPCRKPWIHLKFKFTDFEDIISVINNKQIEIN